MGALPPLTGFVSYGLLVWITRRKEYELVIQICTFCSVTPETFAGSVKISTSHLVSVPKLLYSHTPLSLCSAVQVQD